MATKRVVLKGSLGFAKTYDPDEYKGNRFWAVDFYPKDAEEWDKIKKAGISLRPKEPPTEAFRIQYNLPPGKFIRLRRPTQKLIKNKIEHFKGPDVIVDGKVVGHWVQQHDGTYEFNGDPIFLGNGTKAIVSVDVYDTAMGPGHRLTSIDVVELVVYEKPEEEESPAEEATETRKVPW